LDFESKQLARQYILKFFDNFFGLSLCTAT
jgi:hypothetical protein